MFAVTFLAYAPALRGGFIWNDSDYVTAPALRSVAGFWRIWFELGATEQYYPLLHSAFWIEHRLWGDAAVGYHLFNVAAHATSACLLAAILRRLMIPGAWLAAFVFALHPVGVESVAWISEQKNTLSLVFYLLAALVYLRFDATRRPRWHALATLLFVAGLLTKSVIATLPPALLVIFWWQRGRIDGRRDVLPLVPWFALGAAMGLLSAYVEKVYIGAEGAEFALTLLQRALLAGRVVWFYVGKLVWPDDLIFIYPRWEIDPGQPWQWLPSIAVIVALGVLWRMRGWSRGPLAAVLFFGGSLVPTIGFFNVYAFRFSYVADHWQYLPALGLIVLGAAGIVTGLRRAGAPAAVRVLILALLPAVLAWRSVGQSRMYADMPTFYATTLARNPAAWMAHNNLGGLLREAGELDAARTHFEAALQVRPDLEKVHNNLGLVFLAQRREADAERHFQRAIELRPDYADALNSLGALRRQQRRLPESMELLFRALQIDPEFADAHNNLGMTLRDAGRLTDAIRQFERAVRLAPTMAAAHLNLALSLSLAGRNEEAMGHFREARRLNPAIPDLTAR